MKILFEDLGQIDYKKAWDYQETIHQQIVSGKLSSGNQSDVLQRMIFCEHPNVFTLGKSGSSSNLLINKDFLKSIGADFYQINRGGDITYHGPGQIVGYPIIDLETIRMGVKDYIHHLEESIIKTLDIYGIKSSRMDGATGVWLETDQPQRTRKICAIGVRISRYVTMHGFALNVNTNLNYFNYINPCGFIDRGVTSIEKELGYKPDMEKIKKDLKSVLFETFGFEEAV